jgi:hypothetical protein
MGKSQDTEGTVIRSPAWYPTTGCPYPGAPSLLGRPHTGMRQDM